MKRLLVAVAVLGVAVCLGFYVNRSRTPGPGAPAEPVAEARPTAEAGQDQQAMEAFPSRAEQPVARPRVEKSISRPVAAQANAGLDTELLNQSVDTLVSPQASFQQKREAWNQLREAGKLDQAIAELETRMANDPRTAEYPAALGQAYLKKCGTIQDVREQGILAMQADKLFDSALTLDPSNWEARFVKAVGMSYWPPFLNKGGEVIEHFQTLIQQQEAQAPQPHFADTYAWLGEQYAKAGRGEDARTVWQRGAALFPADEKLRTKLASTP